MTIRKFLRYAAVGPCLAVFQCSGVIASHWIQGLPTRMSALAWTAAGSFWWGLMVPPTVAWARRDPLRLGTALWPQVRRHLPRALFLSVLSGIGIWATKQVGSSFLGTDPFTMRQLFGNLAASWLLFDFFMYAVVVCAVSVLLYQQRLRDRELEAAQLETALAHTELKLLKAQLDPHFVFNALHTISALVHRDPSAADRMVCRLSDFLRLSLASTGAQEVTLDEELQHLRSYMEVQMVRFRSRLTLQVEVPTELLGCLVPNLLLQPLVENVVKHAVAVALRPVHASVVARRLGGELELEIRDDGPGLPPADERRDGIGVANTRDRLRKLYGERHALVLENLPERGAHAVVRLPLRFAEDAERTESEETLAARAAG